ncbi:hypothetical protein Tco_0217323 [Tanacetum coccineum]
MDTKWAWFQEKYSGRTHGGRGCSSSQTDFPLIKKELHQLRMDEKPKRMLKKRPKNKKGCCNSPFKLETFTLNSSVLFVAWVKKGTKVASGAPTARNVCSTGRRSSVRHCNSRAYRTTHHCGDWRGSLLEEVAFADRLVGHFTILFLSVPLNLMLNPPERTIERFIFNFVTLMYEWKS